FRIDVSGRIDAGSSWQLGFFTAHALWAADRLAVSSAEHEVLLWTTGTVGNSDLSVGEVGYVTQKLNLSLERLAKEARAGKQVVVALPAANGPEIDAELRKAIEATGAQFVELDQVGQLLRCLDLPPAVYEAAAAESVWRDTPFRSLEPFEARHRDIFFG